jgi:hypothetical protein
MKRWPNGVAFKRNARPHQRGRLRPGGKTAASGLPTMRSNHDADADDRRRRARERTARWRKRVRRGQMVLQLEIDGDMLDLVQRLEHVGDAELADRRAVALAARRLLTRALALLVHQELRNIR